MRTILPLLISVLLLISCHDPVTKSDTNQYEPGTVLIGFKTEVSLRQALDYLNAKNLSFEEIRTTVYVSALPADSLDFINSKLATKPYLGQFDDDLANIAFDGSIRVDPWFTRFDAESLNDWLKTCDELKLELVQNPNVASSTATVKVIPGSENDWIKELLASPMIKWAELNCMNCIHLD